MAAGNNIETEVKIRFEAGAEAARKKIEDAGYPVESARILESDILYDRADGELRAAGKLIRLRRLHDGITEQRAMVTYKGPAAAGRYKSREEIEFDVRTSGAFEEVLNRLGYSPRFAYEKFRTQFRKIGEPGVVTLDETPMGVFLELEGPEYWIDAAATALGFPATSYITASYATLYREYRQQNPGTPENMVFAERHI